MVGIIFSVCYLATLLPILGYCRGDSLINLMLISAFFSSCFDPRVAGSSRNKVTKSLGPAECLAGFKPGSFWILCIALTHQASVESFHPLGHSHTGIIWKKFISIMKVVLLLRYFSILSALNCSQIITKWHESGRILRKISLDCTNNCGENSVLNADMFLKLLKIGESFKC